MELKTLQKTFISISLVIGLLMIFLIPPLQMPDEDSHFKNIYSMSNFDFLATQKDGITGKYYPIEIVEFTDSMSRLYGNLDEKYSYKEMYFNDALYGTPLREQEKVFNTHTAQTASPIMYLPQLIGVWIFKVIYAIPVFGGIDAMKPIHYLYAARMGNLLGFITMGIYALRLMPVYKKLTFAILLMPMTISLAASVSYDVMVIGISFLLIAYIMKLIYRRQGIKKNEYISILVLACILIQLKIVYFCFIGLFLLMYNQMQDEKKRFIKQMILLICVPIGVYWISNSIAKINLDGVIDISGSFPKEQLEYIVLHPIQYIKVLFNTFIQCRGYYLSSFVGKFGALDTNLPDILIVVYSIYLLVLAVFDSEDNTKVTWRQKGMYVVIALGCIVLTETALYIVWTSIPEIGGVGSSIVSGVQGRYFIPCSILGLLIFYNTKLKNRYQRLYYIIEEHFLDIQRFFCIISCVLIFVRFWV